MAAQHLPRDLVRPSSGLTTRSNDEEEEVMDKSAMVYWE